MSLKVKVTTNKYTILAACFCLVKHHWPLIMTEYVIGQPIIFSPCDFFFPRIFSAIGNWMSTHGLLKIQVAKNRHLGTITPTVSLELRHVSTIGKILVKQWYILHMFLQYGEPRPTNGWDRFGSLGHLANFNGFRILPSLLQQRHSLEANQTACLIVS